MNTFYAYIHCRPDGSPFYVGKGKGERCYDLKGRAQYHQRVINKHGVENVLVGRMDCSSESIAFDLEVGLIKCFRRMGVELTNQTAGGEGVSGYIHTQESKDKLSKSTSLFLSNPLNHPFYKKKRPLHAVALSGRKRPEHSEFMQRYIAENGAPMFMLDKKHSAETIAKMKTHGAEVGARSSALFRGVAKPEAQKAKMSKSASGHVWLHKEGKRTHCKEEKAARLEADGWKRGQK